jgi:hypothetical protein
MARGEKIVKDVFGGTLQQQGRGFYVALELFAILRGSLLLERREDDRARLLPSKDADAVFLRPSHDFARRIMSDGFREKERPRLREHVSEESCAALRSLLLGVQAPVPGRRSDPPDWRKWHLYPYPPDFIHYDALHRHGKINIERDSYRGGGGLAHRILREDPDSERLGGVREGLRALLSDSEGPLGTLARALGELDEAREQADRPFTDEVEKKSSVLESPWVNILRDGTLNILTCGLPASKRIETLMHWVPFCILRHQLALAHARLGFDPIS